MLIHHVDDLRGKNGNILFSGLKIIKKQKKVKKIGVSIYSFDDLKWILKNYKIDIVQVPFNIFDQRLILNKWLKKLKKKKVEVHCRSVFLQGLIFKSNSVPKRLKKIKKKIIEFHKWSKSNKISPIKAAIGFVLNYAKIDKLIIGVDNYKQLMEIINSLDNKKLKIPKKFCIKEEKLINPSLW